MTFVILLYKFVLKNMSLNKKWLLFCY